MTTVALSLFVRFMEQVLFKSLLLILVAVETERWQGIDKEVLPVPGMGCVTAQTFALRHRRVARLQPRDSSHIVVAPVTELFARRTEQVLIGRGMRAVTIDTRVA